MPVRIDRSSGVVSLETSWSQKPEPKSEKIDGETYQFYELPVRGSHVLAPIGWLKREGDVITGRSYQRNFDDGIFKEPVFDDGPSCPECGNAIGTCGCDGKDAAKETKNVQPLPARPNINFDSGVSSDLQDSMTSDNDVPIQPVTPESMLSSEGMAALKNYFTTPREVLRRIPARILKLAVSYHPLLRWLAPALVSELTSLDFDKFVELFQRTTSVPEKDWQLFEREARLVLDTAKEFDRMLSSESTIRNLLA